MNIESEITLTLNISFDVSHFEVIINPVYNEVWEPWVLSANLEQFIEKLETLLTKVIAKDLKAHQSLILRKCLGKQSEAHIVDLIICHVEMNQAPINSYGLSDSLRSVITALVVGKVQGLKRAVVGLQVFSDGLAATEGDLVGVEIEDLEGVVF